ncbi:MAG: FecR domain-containing protein [Candidatus Uhrbacteria bacterium]|nr:FecR domain-containing protein [Candidatus Uhrbacteria bacterium]
MKRLSFFGVSIAAVIAVALGVWFINRPVPKPVITPAASVSAPLPESQPAVSSLLVTPIASIVSVALSTNTSVFQPITSATQVVEGSHVKTSATGRALIEGMNTTVIDSNTEIALTVLDTQKNQTRLQLEAGQVWSRVKKLSDKGEFYEIESQNARASVRGTSFGLKRVGHVLTLYVVEGVVNFGTIPPNTDASIQYSSANVPAGKKAVLKDGDAAPVVSDLTDADKHDPWFVFNNPSVGAPPSSNTSAPSITTQTNTSASNNTETIAPPPSNNVSTSTETILPPPSDTSTPPEPTPVSTPQPNRTITPATADSPELLLSSMTPSTMVAGSAVTFTLSGFGFQKAGVSSVLIGNTRITSFKVWDDSTIKMSVDAGQFTVAGDYDVTVEGAQSASSTLSPGLTITRAPISQTPSR